MNDSVLNKITAFFWHIFCLNLIFVASNVVLLGVLLFVVFHWITMPVYLVALFLLIVSLQAMLLTLKRSGQVDEMTVFRRYMLCFREAFKNWSLYAISYLSIAVILGVGYVNIHLIRTNQFLFTSTYLLLFILLYIHFIFGMLIQIHFVIDLKGTWKLGLYCVSKHPFYCLLIFVKTLIVVWVIQIIPALLFLGIIPLFGHSTIKMTEKVFEALKVTLLDTKNES